MLALWTLWTVDPLKSVGMVIPVVSFVLVLRAWRTLGWESDGSWWGLALLVATALVVRLRDQTVLLLVLGPQWTLYFPPHSLVLCLYGVGVALLFGGPRLVRAAVFPLMLLLCANPIPHVFNVYVDLPLQHASAHVARSFAHAIGQPLTPDTLRLMFTPEFGMFIAPGCNGIRGAVTMGYIALIAGYVYRFRRGPHVLAVLGGVALGYVFNFVRLCLLVVAYVVALHLPWLQHEMENTDYVIGAGLFFVGVYLLYTTILRLGQSEAATRPARVSSPEAPVDRGRFAARAGAMALLTVVAFAVFVHAWRAAGASTTTAASDSQPGAFPATVASAQVGNYTLDRTWNETLPTGVLLFHWADYAPGNGGPHVAIGLSPVLGSHDTLVCHSARGEDPMWHGQTPIATAAGTVSFSTALFNNGVTQYLEATTLCNGDSCGEYSTNQEHFGLVWSRPHPETLLERDPERPIPILIKVETTDTQMQIPEARRELTGAVGSFLAGTDLAGLTRPYRRR